jgi:hypothetical protein
MFTLNPFLLKCFSSTNLAYLLDTYMSSNINSSPSCELIVTLPPSNPRAAVALFIAYITGCDQGLRAIRNYSGPKWKQYNVYLYLCQIHEVN